VVKKLDGKQSVIHDDKDLSSRGFDV
jgi:hypothetical protein